MPWWLDGLLLVTAPMLWLFGSSNRDEVWGLLQKMLAVVSFAVVLLGGRQMILEVALLVMALWIPGANSRKLHSFSSGGEAFEADHL